MLPFHFEAYGVGGNEESSIGEFRKAKKLFPMGEGLLTYT